MTKLLTLLIITFFTITSAQAANTTHEAGKRFQDLTYNYFFGKNHVSNDVKKVIASDIQTAPKVLKFLTQDTDKTVRLLAKKNLSQLRTQQ